MTFSTPDFLSRTSALLAVAAHADQAVTINGHEWIMRPALAERAGQACLARFRNGLCRLKINNVGMAVSVELTDHGKRVAARAARMFNLGA
jgi:hypothetical protein